MSATIRAGRTVVGDEKRTVAEGTSQNGAAPEGSKSAEKQHEEFARQNGDWHERVEEAFRELDELAGGPASPPRKK